MDMILMHAAMVPFVVLAVSVITRRVGPQRGGRLLGIPATTGPFLLIMFLGSGAGAAARAAQGSAAGQLAVGCFCLVYGRLAARLRPVAALGLALAGAGLADALAAVSGSTWLAAGLAVAVAVGGLATWPEPKPGGSAPESSPRSRSHWWEVPVRMGLSFAIVLFALVAARSIGAVAGGMLVALPVVIAVMGPSVHRTAGGAAAADLMRGALTSCIGTSACLLMLAAALAPLGGVAFVAALVTLVVADQGVRASLPRLAGA
jgi:hypothetical protein